MGIRERGRRAVRTWTAAVALLGVGATGIASIGAFVAIEQAAGTTTSSTAASTGTSSSSTASSGLSTGSGSSSTTSSGS